MAKLIFSGDGCQSRARLLIASSFADDHADHGTGEVEQRSAAVARLDRRADLQMAGVIEYAAQRTDDARVTVKSDVSNPR